MHIYNKYAGFSKKRFGLGHQRSGGADVTQFFCEICKISCAGAQTFKEHQEGEFCSINFVIHRRR